MLVVALGLSCTFAQAAPLPPLVCPAGGPLGAVDLRVASSRANRPDPLPLRSINRIEEGDSLIYRPLLRPAEDRRGEVTFVLAPADPAKAGDPLVVLEPKEARKPQEWHVPWRVGVVLFVYGPAGLNAHKVRNFLSRDTELISQLAEYAEKTAQTEALIAALSSPNSSSASVQTALRGFAGPLGVAQMDHNAPPDQQAMLLFRTLQPAVATWDPIAPQGGSQLGQTASLATSVATLFFGSPVGLAAGGTAMVLELRAVAFPRAEFRSSLSQSLPNDAMGLCGRRDPAPPHTHVAYLWASRIPNIAPPQPVIDKTNSLPPGNKSPLPLAISEAEWKYIDHARNWTLQSEGNKPVPVRVAKLGDTRTLELDLPATVKPGTYTLAANWDWDHFTAKGTVEVRPLGDFAAARFAPSSRDLLVARTGKVPVTLESGDFEFVTKVEIEKLNDKFATAAPVPFVLPRGLRQGAQDRLDVQINTVDLDPGDYKLTLTQVDGRPHPVKFKILAAPPRVEGLPVVLNEGVNGGEFTLKGQRLEQIDRIEVGGAKAELLRCANPTERKMKFNFPPGQKFAAGTSLAMKAWITDRAEPLTFSDAVRIVGARPAITKLTLSRPPELDVQMQPQEIPGGIYLSAMFHVNHLQSNSSMRLTCEGQESPTVTLKLGERAGPLSFQQLTPNQVYLSFDTSVWFSGCALRASIVNGSEGESDPYPLGRIVRVPAIERLEETNLTGQNLETIEKVGWTPDAAIPVESLPLPMAGSEQKQTVRLQLPEQPDPSSPLYVWLRGETTPRQVKLR